MFSISAMWSDTMFPSGREKREKRERESEVKPLLLARMEELLANPRG